MAGPADPSFAVPPGFFAQQGSRDLRIDRTLRSIVASGKAHGQRPDIHDGIWLRLGINLVLRGRGRYVEASGREHELVPGTLFHRYPRTSHATVFDARSDYAELFIVLDASTGAQLMAASLISSDTVVQVGVDPLILTEFHHLQKRISLPESELPSRGVLIETIAFINALYDRGRRNRALGFWAKIVEDAALLLEHNLDERIRAEAVAKQLGVSYAAFRKHFREATGYSPVDYRIRRRLESAQHALMGRSVAGAARQLGYSDAYAFSAQFKAFVGMSPREFQRRMRKQLVLVPLVGG